MGLYNNGQLWIIRLVCWLGWLSSFALAQFDLSEGITAGYVSFPALGVTCLGNLAVFVTSLIRGRLDAEIGARDALDILTSPKLNKIVGLEFGNGLTTCTETTETAPTEGGIHTEEVATPEEGVHTEEEEGGLHTDEEATQAAPTEEGFQREEEATQAASTDGANHREEGFQREEEATQAASTDGANHREEEATQTASTGGGRVHYFRLLLQKVRDMFPSSSTQEDLQVLETAFTERKGLKTADVVMLSYGTPSLSITDFIKSNAPTVDSILLQSLPFIDATNDAKVMGELTQEVSMHTRTARCMQHPCNCILFWTVKEITRRLDVRMLRQLKPLSNFLCLLPCATCLRNGCHEWSTLEPVEHSGEGHRLREGDCNVVSEILDEVSAGDIRTGKPTCICIPLNDADSDNWTELLVRALRSKDAEGRGVRVKASEALEGYLAGGRGGAKESVEYNIISFILPRFIEALINGALSLCFKVDGFSSSLIARRTVRDYLVDSKGSGLAANAFLTKAVVKCGTNNAQVCQVLTFRGSCLCIRTLSVVVGCVNLISSIVWAVLISFEGGPDSYQPPPMRRVAVIFTAIFIAGLLDVLALSLGSLVYCSSGVFFSALNALLLIPLGIGLQVRSIIEAHSIIRRYSMASRIVNNILRALIRPFRAIPFIERELNRARPLIRAAIQFIERELNHAQSLIRALRYPGLKIFVDVFILVLYSEIVLPALRWASRRPEKYSGRWIYAFLQGLVWLKWAVGSYILNFEKSLEFLGESPHTWGILVHSSAFMLNAVLAGVRCEWHVWAWKHNHLFGRKLGL